MLVWKLLRKKPVRREKAYRPAKSYKPAKLTNMIPEKTEAELLLDQYPELKVYWSNGYRFGSDFYTMERPDSHETFNH